MNPTFPDLSTLRAYVEDGKIRVSKASRRRIFAPDVIAAEFRGVNGYGDDCYDLVRAGGPFYTSHHRRAVPACWRVYLAPFAAVTPRGHHWQIKTARFILPDAE